VALAGADTAHPSFTPSLPGAYVFSLVVSDGQISSASDTVTVVVAPPADPGSANQAPTADAGPDLDAPAETQVTLDGSASHDPDQAPAPLSYSWQQAQGPAAVALADADTAHPSFTPSVSGVYAFTLTVSDGGQASAPDTVAVSVADPLPLRLTYPNGGESLKVKQKLTVTWQSHGLPSSVKLKLQFSRNGGRWKPLATVKNTGRYAWKIAKAQAGGTASLRLCGPNSLPSALRCDETDGSFEVRR
jgi:hypothetical protein